MYIYIYIYNKVQKRYNRTGIATTEKELLYLAIRWIIYIITAFLIVYNSLYASIPHR